MEPLFMTGSLMLGSKKDTNVTNIFRSIESPRKTIFLPPPPPPKHFEMLFFVRRAELHVEVFQVRLFDLPLSSIENSARAKIKKREILKHKKHNISENLTSIFFTV